MTGTPELVEISWYVRRPAPEGGWYYDNLEVASPLHCSSTPTRHAPTVGDIVTIGGHDPGTGLKSGTFRVLQRTWLYATYRCPNWPIMQYEPNRGPMMQILLEEATGLFIDERTRPEDMEDDE